MVGILKILKHCNCKRSHVLDTSLASLEKPQYNFLKLQNLKLTIPNRWQCVNFFQAAEHILVAQRYDTNELLALMPERE